MVAQHAVGRMMKVLFPGHSFRKASESAAQPSAGDRIEFLSDRHTDKGPATGLIEKVKITVDGLYVTVRFADGADGQGTFSWDDLGAHRNGDDELWFVKAQPTEAQAKAGNYKKEHRSFQGLPVAIENPIGSVREGIDRGGKRWRVTMSADYGYINRTEGVDGDQVDVYIGPDADAPIAYVITQMAPPDFREVDEQKVMLGYLTPEAAKAAYLAHYDNPRFFGRMKPMPMDEFKRKARATFEKPTLIKGALLFIKGLVSGHQRRLASGKVVQVRPYADRRPMAAGPKDARQEALFPKPPRAPLPPNPYFGKDPVKDTLPLFPEEALASQPPAPAEAVPSPPTPEPDPDLTDAIARHRQHADDAHVLGDERRHAFHCRHAELARRQLEARRAVRALLAEHGDGVELKHAQRDTYRVLLPDASNPGKYRYQSYDRHGLSGHTTDDTREEALRDVALDGFTVHAPGSLDGLSKTDEWKRGTAYASLVREHAAGRIDHPTFAAKVHGVNERYAAQA